MGKPDPKYCSACGKELLANVNHHCQAEIADVNGVTPGYWTTPKIYVGPTYPKPKLRKATWLDKARAWWWRVRWNAGLIKPLDTSWLE